MSLRGVARWSSVAPWRHVSRPSATTTLAPDLLGKSCLPEGRGAVQVSNLPFNGRLLREEHSHNDIWIFLCPTNLFLSLPWH